MKMRDRKLTSLVAGLVLTATAQPPLVALPSTPSTQTEEIRSQDRVEADRLFQAGIDQFPNDPQSAVQSLQQALSLYRRLPTASGQINPLPQILYVPRIFISPELAAIPIEFYQQAISIYQTMHDRQGEASAWRYLAIEYSTRQPQQAIAAYQQARAIYQDEGDRRAEIQTLIALSGFYVTQAQSQPALDVLQQAIEVSQMAGLSEPEQTELLVPQFFVAFSGSYSSDAQERQAEQQRLQASIEFEQQSLMLYQGLGNRLAQARTLNRLANMYAATFQSQPAIDTYEQAAAIYRELGNVVEEAGVYDILGNLYFREQQEQQGQQAYERAIALYLSSDRATAASAMRSLAQLSSNQQLSIELRQQALEIHRQAGDRQQEAKMLSEIGGFHFSVGEFQLAIDAYQQALAINRELDDQSSEPEAANLMALGQVYAALNQKQRAIDFYEQAQVLYRAAGANYQEDQLQQYIDALRSQ